jgi:hypothetical protein
MSNYSKGTFTHQSLRVEKETLLMLREHCAANNLFMAHFAADAIKEKIDRDSNRDENSRVAMCKCEAHSFYEWEKFQNKCFECGGKIFNL